MRALQILAGVLQATQPHGSIRAFWRGCRCVPCRAASAAYQERWRTRTNPARRVDATPARLHLLRLAERGMGRDRIALLTGISDWVIARIRDRQQATANRDTVARLLACPVDLAEGMTTTSWWTRKYILALRAEGYTDQTIAQWIGSWPPDIFSRVRVRQRTARRAATIYRAISADDLPAGPSLLGFLTNRSRPESHVD